MIDQNIIRNNAVITVCLASTKNTVLRKGVDFYVALANELPELSFYVIGVEEEALLYLESIAGSNVILLSRIPQKELKELFCTSRIVCQFSRYEAFGVALLEGISSGCYPIGYSYGGTKEILIDNLGDLINNLDVDEGKVAILNGILKTQADVEPIKRSIDERFNIDVRRGKLIEFIGIL